MLFSHEITKAIDNCESLGELLYSGLIRIYLATFYINNNNPSKALDLLLIHLPNIEKASYPRLTIDAYATIAKAYWHKDKKQRAKEFALKGWRILFNRSETVG